MDSNTEVEHKKYSLFDDDLNRDNKKQSADMDLNTKTSTIYQGNFSIANRESYKKYSLFDDDLNRDNKKQSADMELNTKTSTIYQGNFSIANRESYKKYSLFDDNLNRDNKKKSDNMELNTETTKYLGNYPITNHVSHKKYSLFDDNLNKDYKKQNANIDLNTETTTYQGNCPIANYVNHKKYSLFDDNLDRVNQKLKCVNDYYIPKYNHHSVENPPEVVEMEELTNPIDEQSDQCINFFSELHKLAMVEIENMRKEYVQGVLIQKVNTWENKKTECFNKSKNIDKKLMNSIREKLVICKNYNKEICKDNDNLKIRLLDEQKKYEEKKRCHKFNFAVKNAMNVLSNIKKLLNEYQICVAPQFPNNEISELLFFETSMDKFKNILSNPNEQDLLDLNKLLQNMQIFQDKFMITFENDKKKIEKDKFSFTLDNNENKLNEFNTFKFNIDEENVSRDIDLFSFKTTDIENNNEIKNENGFENEYKQILDNYIRIQKHLKETENLYSLFLYDNCQKSYKQELMKAINTPVNSISSSSSWFMKDKFDKLDILLKCQPVKTGNSMVSANNHPSALIFCKDTLAKKIISIGEQVISVKEETAFEVSSIITELWQAHPDFGILLYARFKQKCPCLIPFNAAKSNDETEEDYYKSLGYNFVNGVVEAQNKYVTRMTGIIRLFAAIIVTESKSGKALGIGQAWMIISATANLVPQLDITAILLHEMLKTTSYYLKHAYGRQFIKMLHYINTNYMKKIEEVTPIEYFGPVQRLKTFVSKLQQGSYIDKPQGILPSNFW